MQRWGKNLHFSTVAKLVLFGIATNDLGTGLPFISVGGWREKEIFFQGKDNLHIASRMPENNRLKAGSCTIWAASELGLLMQIEYLHSQVFFQSCTSCSAFPHFLALVSIAACNHTLTQMPFHVQSTECYRAY